MNIPENRGAIYEIYDLLGLLVPAGSHLFGGRLLHGYLR